jgi:hypothetical protein
VRFILFTRVTGGEKGSEEERGESRKEEEL